MTPLAAASLPVVAGYVEAVTADRMLGWAWGPRAPGLRAIVELRLGQEVVASTVAEQPRPDLASSGIGDGNHAFELVIPATLQGRAAELSVWARAGDADPVRIGAPPAAEALSDQVVRLLHGLEAVMGAQRVLHRGIQALASQQDTANLAKITAAQEVMVEQFAMLERFVVRLDERLLAMTPTARGVGRIMPPATTAALTVATVALIVGVTGLVRSLGL